MKIADSRFPPGGCGTTARDGIVRLRVRSPELCLRPADRHRSQRSRGLAARHSWAGGSARNVPALRCRGARRRELGEACLRAGARWSGRTRSPARRGPGTRRSERRSSTSLLAYPPPSASPWAGVRTSTARSVRARAAIMVAALRGEAIAESSRRTALRVLRARAAAVSGMPAAAVCLPGLAGGPLSVGVRRPVLRVVVRPVSVPAAAVHEEHGQRAGEEEKEQDEGCRVHRAPPFVLLAGQLRRSACRAREARLLFT